MRYYILALATFISMPIHASPKCDTETHNFLKYYSTTLPKNLMDATPSQLTQKVAEERDKAKKQQISFYDACIWQEMVKGKEVVAQYREIDRLFVNIDSYLATFRTTKNKSEVNFILGRYCGFISKGVTSFPQCRAGNEL